MSGCCSSFVPGIEGGGGGGPPAPAASTAFQYAVTGVEPDLMNLTIALPAARANTNYGVVWSQEQFTDLLGGGIQTASKTLTEFVLSLTADATAGDIFTFIVQDL